MRNIGIMAHIDAGKTTTTERILFYTGESHKIGNVDDGNTVTDWMEQEKERGITIQSAAITTSWKGEQINIIDTPGHVDFTAEVERSLRVLDGAVAVFCAVGGVEPQSETVWKQSIKYNVPKIAFINKMDRMGADYYRVISQIEKKFLVKVAPITIPCGSESSFCGVVDVLKGKFLEFTKESQGSEIKEADIPEEYKYKYQEAYEKLLDVASEFSDELMEKVLLGEPVDAEQIVKALQKGVLETKVLPTYAGSSLKNIGIQPLLDGIVDFLPSPRVLNSNEATALVFKVQNDQQSGFYSYVKVYSGTIKKGVMLNNLTRGGKERVLRILRMHSIQVTELSELKAGDIGVIVGFKNAYTGDTISSSAKAELLERPTFATPVVSIAIEPKSTNDSSKLVNALTILSHEDPTFTFKNDSSTGQLVISGMGELHLDVLIRRLKDEFSLDCNSGSPQVSFKEGISTSGEKSYTFSKLIGQTELKSTTTLRISTLQESGNYLDSVVSLSPSLEKRLSKTQKDLVLDNINNCLQSGIVYGYEIKGAKVEVVDIQADEGCPDLLISSSINMCFDALCRTLNPIMLEPMMDVRITSPAQFAGDCVNLLSMRSGVVEKIEDKGNNESEIFANTKLKELFGFATLLRSSSQGRANFTMSFKGYYPV